MSVPIFQRKEIWKLKDIIEIIKNKDEEELFSYLEGEFLYQGIK